MRCSYKKIFLKDLAKIPKNYRLHIEKLVFKDIPETRNIFEITDIRKMKGYGDFYRIRVGVYRIGCKIEQSREITFYRVKHRNEIYKVFP